MPRGQICHNLLVNVQISLFREPPSQEGPSGSLDEKDGLWLFETMVWWLEMLCGLMKKQKAYGAIAICLMDGCQKKFALFQASKYSITLCCRLPSSHIRSEPADRSQFGYGGHSSYVGIISQGFGIVRSCEGACWYSIYKISHLVHPPDAKFSCAIQWPRVTVGL